MIFRQKFLLLFILNWAMAAYAIAQSPIPAFPEIITVDQLFSRSSVQFHLKKSRQGDELLAYDKGVTAWMVNLKELDPRTISFQVRSAKLKPLYQGKVFLDAKGIWQIEFSEAMPGQAIMLLFIADRLTLKGEVLTIRSEDPADFSADRIDKGAAFLGEMMNIEQSLDFERWRLRQLRKYGDNGTQLSALRNAASKQLKNYLDAVFGK